MPFKDYQPASAASRTATNPADDEALVEALRRRDDTAYRALVHRYTPLMLRLARQHVPNQAIAEEVVQDTWVVVLRGIDAFQGRCRVTTWLMRILLNTARKCGVREHTPTRWDALSAAFCAAEPAQISGNQRVLLHRARAAVRSTLNSRRTELNQGDLALA